MRGRSTTLSHQGKRRCCILSVHIISTTRILEFEDGTASQGWCTKWAKWRNSVATLQ